MQSNMFDWNLCVNSDEVIDELCAGVSFLKYDDMLTVVATIIFQMGMDFKEISKRIDEVDEVTFLVPPQSSNDDTQGEHQQ